MKSEIQSEIPLVFPLIYDIFSNLSLGAKKKEKIMAYEKKSRGRREFNNGFVSEWREYIASILSLSLSPGWRFEQLAFF